MTAFAPNEKKWRGAFLAATPIALGLLKIFPPEILPGWAHASCGAITGLPCIFCGLTRATHCFLNGDFQHALYFNWLVFPLVAGAATLWLGVAAEMSLGKRLMRQPKLRLTRRSLGGVTFALLLLWVLQVYLAVSQHKTELLNPRGPLYSFVVR